MKKLLLTLALTLPNTALAIDYVSCAAHGGYLTDELGLSNYKPFVDEHMKKAIASAGGDSEKLMTVMYQMGKIQGFNKGFIAGFPDERKHLARNAVISKYEQDCIKG